MADVALSTMWGIGQFSTLAGFFAAARDLGFSQFELNHAVNSNMLDGLNLNGGCITSIHEPCPADISTSEFKARNWLLSAPDEDDRRQGVAATRRSIDLAHQLGAQAVIVHLGQVDIAPSLDSRVRDLYRQGRSGQPEYCRAKDQLAAARAAQVGINMRAVRCSMAELAEYADRVGIRLGLENRYHYPEIPLPDELDELLGMGLGEVVGYWHDVGHAQALANLGFDSHEEWLRRFASRMVGVHLHDIVGLQDHLAAGLGCLDWDMVARYLPPSVLRTCEFQACNSPEEVAAGVRLLVEKGCVIGS